MPRLFNQHIKSCLLVLLVALTGISCKKFVEVNPGAGIIETADVFSNDQTALSAVAGLHVRMRSLNNAMTNGGLSLYASLSADDLWPTSSVANTDAFYKNAFLSNNSIVYNNFWIFSYRNIYQANAILEGLNQSVSLTDSVKRHITGEVKLIRALDYFYLVNLFGKVPYITGTDYRVNATKERTAVSEIYQELIQEVTMAEQLLPSYYLSVNRARPNGYMAAALLARLYLYTGNYQAAADWASRVIDSGVYSLEGNLSNTFLIASNEVIWQISSDVANTAEGMSFVPASATARPNYALTASLLSSFEPNDKRKLSWTKTNINNGNSYTFPYKYKQRSSATISEYNVVCRLAELYLIRAEARALLNDFNGALEDINLIRERAGLDPLISIANQQDLLAAIEKENRSEYFCEWGHRWLDLKRWGQADSILGLEKGTNWQPTDALYPIPFNELTYNVMLTQNPGY
jgi:starch-binding outer membrane protein, SusD/RagB family